MSRFWRAFQVAFLLSIILMASLVKVNAQTADEQPVAVVLTLDGPLTQVMQGYLERGLATASDLGAEVIIIQLNTPGGAVDLTETLIQVIRGSQVPVVVYVSPRGAMAASAGTLITLAGHLSAMAPETTIGAASPVGSQGEDVGATMETKVKEILKATARTLTAGRPPEAVSLAEDMIENARAVTVDEALAIGLVDFKAMDVQDLLNQLDSRQVEAGGVLHTLQTANARVEEVGYTFVEDLLMWLIDPNILFLLLAVGVQLILIELSNPGGWVAGFVGVVCLLLAFFGMGVLPVDWFGLIFIVVSFALFIMELNTPTHGALTVAGAISFFIGALVLFNSVRLPGIPPISLPLVILTSVFIAGLFLAAVAFALRAQRLPVKMGDRDLVGQIGTVRGEMSPDGQAQVGGELWSAGLEDRKAVAQDGARVKVVEVKGLWLKVKKTDDTP